MLMFLSVLEPRSGSKGKDVLPRATSTYFAIDTTHLQLLIFTVADLLYNTMEFSINRKVNLFVKEELI